MVSMNGNNVDMSFSFSGLCPFKTYASYTDMPFTATSPSLLTRMCTRSLSGSYYLQSHPVWASQILHLELSLVVIFGWLSSGVERHPRSSLGDGNPSPPTVQHQHKYTYNILSLVKFLLFVGPLPSNFLQFLFNAVVSLNLSSYYIINML